MATDEELVRLVQSDESDRIELKRNAENLDQVRDAICAFANDLPNYKSFGAIIIGLENDRSCADLEIDDRLLLRLAALRDDGTITPFPTMAVRKIDINGCICVAIVVEPSINTPVRTRGIVRIRVGPRRGIATPDEERQLVEKRRWGNLPFDAQPVPGAALSDLDLRRFQLEYLPNIVAPEVVAQNQRTTVQQLRALRLVGPDETPTATAILMLGISPQSWFPGAYISWRQVNGSSVADPTINDRTVTGTIPDQLREVEQLIDNLTLSSIVMGDARHKRSSIYPLAALQQLVRNAVLHRNYETSNSPVRVTWYIDRVEIISPGGPFGAVSATSFGQPGVTDYRNPTLAEAMKAYGYVERFGQGLEIVRISLQANGNPPVTFEFQPPVAPTWVMSVVRSAS